MYYLLPSLLTLLLAGLVGLLVLAHRQLSLSRARVAALESEKDALSRDAAAREERHALALAQQEQLREQDLQHAAACHELELENLRGMMAKDKLHYDELKQKQEEHWQANLKQLEERFKNLAAEILSGNSAKLKDTNREQMEGILKPLREQLDKLGAAVQESNKETAGAKASLAEQLRQLMEKTEHLGQEALSLSHALRGDSKVQGDWGEMILEKMLERSGLVRDEHYFIQENIKDENNKNNRPDVIVRFPRERSVIIDSKVSLTAYVQYAAATDDTERAAALKAHLLSVKKHIDELAKKNYAALVKESIGYVLMFLPNEASYIAAVQADPTLTTYALENNIIVVSPTNLVMALQLAHNLWQNEAQQQNVEKIFDRATQLYEKFQGFQQSFMEVGNRMQQAVTAYEEADKKLSRGNGNFVRQVEMLTQMGVTPNPKKRLALTDED